MTRHPLVVAVTLAYIGVLVALVVAAVRVAEAISARDWRVCLERHGVCVQDRGDVVRWVPDET